MQYVHQFVGGPFDGGYEDAGRAFGTILLRQHVQLGIERFAIYEFEGTTKSGDVVERIFQYRRTELRDRAIEYQRRGNRSIFDEGEVS